MRQVEQTEESAVSLVAPYLPVLVVLAVTSIQLLRGRHINPVAWAMAFALVVLVLSRELLRLVDAAYAGLPRHRLSSAAPCLRIKLLLMPSTRRRGRSAPPPLSMLSGAGLLAGLMT